MNWLDQLDRILEHRLFVIGGEPVRLIQLILFLVTLVVTLYAARLIRKLLERHLLTHFALHAGARYTLARLAQYLIWVFGLAVALKTLQFDLTTLAVVAGALGVGIGFGLQNIVANFVAGLVLLFERPIEVGDRVTVQDVEGNVRDINFRATTVLTNDNITVIVPNSQFLNNAVTNWSHGDPRVRIHVPVGVAYGSDTEKVTRSLMGVAAATDGVLKDPAPSVFFREFGDSSLDFELLVWIDQPARHLQIRSRLNYGIDAAFRKEGIEIPFPQRDVHVRSARGLSGMVVRTGPETDPT
jgi:small-conductance mechanosensitive channel